MARAFVAVRLPEVVLDAIVRATSDLWVPGRSTTRDQWHLTLQFLGDDADIESVSAALESLDAAGGRVRMGGAGAFPDPRHARVLWLGLTEGVEVLSRLAGEVAARSERLGHVRETRPFRPHVTLARFGAPSDLRTMIAEIGDDPIGPAWQVDAVTVYESLRRSDGSEYVERATIPLGG